MRELFVNMENNHYLPPGTAGHGFAGYFDTNSAGTAIWEGYDDLQTVLGIISESLGGNASSILDSVTSDVNFLSPSRDQAQGVFGQTLHVDEKWHRFSSRKYILDTVASGAPLTVKLNTLATKLIFSGGHTAATADNSTLSARQATEETTDESTEDSAGGAADASAAKKKPRVIGVEFLTGKSVYRADPRNNGTQSGTPGKVYARKEVIVSGGAFNTPQLLKLSGLGPKRELRGLGIPVVADLPGVGARLQDNHEVPIVARAAKDFAGPPADPGAPACTFGAPGDPCLPLWEDGTGPYASFGQINSVLRKSADAALGERDVYMTGGTFAIRGFWPPTDSVPFDPADTFALSTVKIHPRSAAGTVLLRSADPRDPPAVNFRLFPDAAARRDLDSYVDTVRWARRAFAAVPGPIGPLTPVEPPCGGGGVPAADGTCDDEADREWVMDQVFGHHPTSTCAIGGDGDRNAVLDSKLRVRGVEGLRVVDASAFPRTPGPFPLLPVFLISEKAAEMILGG
jgi:choline dehydrogenase